MLYRILNLHHGCRPCGEGRLRGSRHDSSTRARLTVGIILLILTTPVPARDDSISRMLSNPPGRMVDVGTHKLYIYCLGNGERSVILDSGLGGFSLDWWEVQHQLAAQGNFRVCAYDRTGYGWSDYVSLPRVSSSIAGELGALLERARIKPPYILVGHSFGGFNIRYYAALYPRQVAGMVLVDASHAQQYERIPIVQTPEIEILPFIPQRMVTILPDKGSLHHYPAEIRNVAAILISSRKSVFTLQRESMNIKASAEEIQSLRMRRHIPLVVVSRGRRVWPETPLGDTKEREWKKMQQELAEMVPGTPHLIAEDSGHMVHMERPDIIVRAINMLYYNTCLSTGCPPANQQKLSETEKTDTNTKTGTPENY